MDEEKVRVGQAVSEGARVNTCIHLSCGPRRHPILHTKRKAKKARTNCSRPQNRNSGTSSRDLVPLGETSSLPGGTSSPELHLSSRVL